MLHFRSCASALAAQQNVQVSMPAAEAFARSLSVDAVKAAIAYRKMPINFDNLESEVCGTCLQAKACDRLTLQFVK